MGLSCRGSQSCCRGQAHFHIPRYHQRRGLTAADSPRSIGAPLWASAFDTMMRRAFELRMFFLIEEQEGADLLPSGLRPPCASCEEGMLHTVRWADEETGGVDN